MRARGCHGDSRGIGPPRDEETKHQLARAPGRRPPQSGEGGGDKRMQSTVAERGGRSPVHGGRYPAGSNEVATPLQRKAEHRGAPKLPETSRDALALQWGRPVDRGLRDTKVEETLCNLRARDRTKCRYRWVSREPTTLGLVRTPNHERTGW